MSWLKSSYYGGDDDDGYAAPTDIMIPSIVLQAPKYGATCPGDDTTNNDVTIAIPFHSRLSLACLSPTIRSVPPANCESPGIAVRFRIKYIVADMEWEINRAVCKLLL